jgi:hypothetical protein
MTVVIFSGCVVLLLVTLLCDLWVSGTLRRGTKTPAVRALLRVWPLQVLLHVVVLFLVASARPAPVVSVVARVVVRSLPRPLSPALPPLSLSVQNGKQRVQHL